MPIIAAVAHAVPPHAVAQREVREYAAHLFGQDTPDQERIRAVFDNSRVEHRRFMMPVHWYGLPHGLADRSRVFLEDGLSLLQTAARQCLDKARITADRVDQLIFVTSTGHATPTPDAYLINRLGCLPGTVRLPIWGLGCSGGAAGLARAFDFCVAHPRARVLLTALECCSLAFMPDDASKKNIVATSLFSDGSAAVLVAGDEAGCDGVRVTATASHLFPDSYRMMGWDFLDQGMNLVLSPALPILVREQVARLVEEFLASQGLTRTDLAHIIAHPGGARVIDAIRTALGLEPSQLRFTEEVLCRFGNMSSVSVLMVLEQWLSSEQALRSGHGLMIAFGPGFSAEMLLLEV